MTIKKTLTIVNKSRTNSKRIKEIKEKLERVHYNDNLIIELSNEKQLLEVENKILKDNARITLFNAVLPVVIEKIEKYNNKPYGEKTREKISQEIKSVTGCDVYFSSDEFTIYPRQQELQYYFRYNELDVHTQYNQDKRGYIKLLLDNKVQALPPESFKLSYCKEYCKNPKARAKQIIKQFSDLKEKEKTFSEECSRFNELLPSCINNIYPRNFRSYLLSDY